MGNKFLPHTLKGWKKFSAVSFFIGVFIVVGSLWGYNAYIQNQSSLFGGEPFALTLTDPYNPTVPMELSSFDASLVGLLPGKDASNAANWEAISGVSDLADITEAVVEEALADHDALYAIYNGTMENDDTTYDDGYGDRTYGESQAPIIDGNNALTTHVTPSSGASILIFNSNTGAQITTANITAEGINFTVCEYLNNCSAGAYDQAYVSYTNYVGTVVCPNVIITITGKTGSTAVDVTTGDLFATNFALGSSREGATQLKFSNSVLSTTPIYHSFTWGNDAIAAAAYRIVSPSTVGIVQKYGTTAI
jgi:hypothetical protein